MSKGGPTSTTWKSGWNSGKTTTIRVPIALKDNISIYAKAVDSKLINDIPDLTGDFLQQKILEVIERYVEYKRQNYHPNQNSRELDTSTRAWDELRKFKMIIETSFDKLGSTNVE
ncbi:hypothetical protein [Nostoc sp. UHCC 0252]|uniref:hypothetical protein n=1 Tax=Nostoc sp. UHCC 0252 TaxID=3110241 RepID=UPI002B21EA63|nr:hypothetical protein [Nostoc sp. UHCC 0252]MEA5601066.1 hypothetical protein [Nostoc sp. UHCC 0252]